MLLREQRVGSVGEAKGVTRNRSKQQVGNPGFEHVHTCSLHVYSSQAGAPQLMGDGHAY